MDYNLLIAARNEYTKQLGDILCEGIYQNIKSIWNLCKKESKREVLKTFQKKLCDIPLWNQEIINSKFDQCIDDSKITKEYLDKIIEAVFLSNIKILSVVKVDDTKRTININVPDTKNFIHKCYIETARKFFTDPYLIDDRESGSNTHNEIQRNVKRSHSLVKDSIEKTIRSLIPMEEILTSYLKEAPLQSDSNSESDKEKDYYEPEPEPEYIPEPEPEHIPEQIPEHFNEAKLQDQDLFQKDPEPVAETNFEQDPGIFEREPQEKIKINLKDTEVENSRFFSDSD